MAGEPVELELRISERDVAALDLLLERVGQAVGHLRWALREYRRDLAGRPDGGGEPIPLEDRTL